MVLLPALALDSGPILLTRTRSRTFPASDLHRAAVTVGALYQPLSSKDLQGLHDLQGLQDLQGFQLEVENRGKQAFIHIHVCRAAGCVYVARLRASDGNAGAERTSKACAGVRRRRLDYDFPTPADVKTISAGSMLVTDIYGPHRVYPTSNGPELRVNEHMATPPPYLDVPAGGLQTVQRVGEHVRAPLAGLSANKPRAPLGADQGLGSNEADSLFLVEKADPDSMRAALRLTVIIGQVFSLLPISTSLTRVPKFRYLSFRVLYWALVTMGLALNALLSFIDQTGSPEANSITGTSRWVFYLSAMTISVLYFRLAQRWRELCLCFLRVERGAEGRSLRGPPAPALPPEWRRNPPGIGLRLRVITVLTLSLALAEYSLSQISSVMQMTLEKYSFSNLNTFLEDRFKGNYHNVALLIPYSPLVFLIQQILNTTATFVWNYNDIFVMLISILIARRFEQLNSKLHSDAALERSEAYWKSAREAYNALSYLTRQVDDLLCSQILFSFMNNLYFICIQLLHTVKNERNTLLQNIYFTYSFGFLLARTMAVSLCAASINDESKMAKKVLYSVPSDTYCDEVDRFLTQVTSDEIALTGFKFFSVTRSVLLTMAGTIATYEIVMVQFSGNSKAL